MGISKKVNTCNSILPNCESNGHTEVNQKGIKLTYM